jgi:3'-5' exonuclease
LHREGRAREINDYCMFDTLDTYFVFLRTRVLTGELTLDHEKLLVARARAWLESKAGEMAAVKQYLDNWVD